MSSCHGSNMFGCNKLKTSLQKLNSHSYKLHQSYLICQMLAKFSRVKSEKKNSVVFNYFLKQACIRKFHVTVVQQRLRNVQKNCDVFAKLFR